jgi:hypothetical protein
MSAIKSIIYYILSNTLLVNAFIQGKYETVEIDDYSDNYYSVNPTIGTPRKLFHSHLSIKVVSIIRIKI